MSAASLRRRLVAFWRSLPARIYGSHVAESRDGITRLSAYAPTVTPEETARLDRKFRQPPVDWDRLPS